MKTIFKTFLLVVIVISGCSSNNDCFTGDSIEQLKVFEVHNVKYSLFLRVSGFQEKEAFYELYKGVPVFDNCGQPNRQFLSIAHIDTSQGDVFKIIVDRTNLNLIYNANGNDQANYRDINIEIKDR